MDIEPLSVDPTEPYSVATSSFLDNFADPGMIPVRVERTASKGVDPQGEAVAGGPAAAYSWAPTWTRSPVDQALRGLGTRLWDMMLDDDKAGGSVGTLAEAILADDLRITPVVTPDAQQSGGPKLDPKKAAEIADFCKFMADRMVDPFDDVLDQVLQGSMVYGSGMAEPALEKLTSGPYAGKLVPHHFTPKPRRSWGYVVDLSGRVTGIAANAVNGGGLKKFDRERFLIHSWFPRGGDPTGAPVLRTAYAGWNAKLQLVPKYMQYLGRFAEPSLIGTCGEKSAANAKTDPTTGEIIKPAQSLHDQLVKFKNGSIIALPYGATVAALEIHGEGQAFLNAFDLFDRWIVFGVLHQVRATLESQYGSKADSTSAQDILTALAIKARHSFARSIRRCFRRIVRLNYGDEAADLYMARYGLGDVDAEKMARWANAVAKLAESGYLAESQLPSLDEMLGLPVRSPGSPRLTAVPAQQGPQGSKGGKPAQKKPTGGAAKP